MVLNMPWNRNKRTGYKHYSIIKILTESNLLLWETRGDDPKDIFAKLFTKEDKDE